METLDSSLGNWLMTIENNQQNTLKRKLCEEEEFQNIKKQRREMPKLLFYKKNLKRKYDDNDEEYESLKKNKMTHVPEMEIEFDLTKMSPQQLELMIMTCEQKNDILVRLDEMFTQYTIDIETYIINQYKIKDIMTSVHRRMIQNERWHNNDTNCIITPDNLESCIVGFTLLEFGYILMTNTSEYVMDLLSELKNIYSKYENAKNDLMNNRKHITNLIKAIGYETS